MTKRQDNERVLQGRIDQLQRELDQARYTHVPVTTTTHSMRAPTPAERYVNPRSRVTILIQKENCLFVFNLNFFSL